MRTPLALLVGCLISFVASAQSAVGWQAYPAYTEVTALASAPGGLWAASDGGVFFYDLETGEYLTATSAGGLQGGPVGALAFDEARGVLWIGYEDGVLERFDPESRDIRAFYEVNRADQYAARGIRRIVVSGDVLYLATDFGVVVFDAAADRVRSAYSRFGDLEAGTGVNDVLEAPLAGGGPGLWVATDGGVYAADRGADNLQAPGAWTRDAGFEGAAFSFGRFNGELYVGGGPNGARDVYWRNAAGEYSRQLFIDNAVTTLVAGVDRLYGVSATFAYAIQGPGQPASSYSAPDVSALSDLVVGPDGDPWAGDAAFGLFRLPPRPASGVNSVDPDPVAPPGPLTTDIVSADIGDDGVLWLVTRRLESAQFASVSRFEDGVWTSYRTDDAALDLPQSAFLTATVAPDGALFAGSAGDGLAVFREGGVTTYREANSSLLTAPGTSGFVVVRGVAFEDDVAWVLNTSGRPLHRFDGETWRGFAYPSGIPSTAEAFRIAIDRLGQKWLALGTSGLAAWDTGADPLSGADDRAVRFTNGNGNGVGLPDPDVRDVVVTPDGRVWLGTARGIAYVFQPLNAFASDPSLAAPQWPITEDGSDYFLRDVEVFDLEVDPAGQIWVGTSSGAYLVNAEGTEVVRSVDASNSPLPSDAVFSVSVDAASGRVYFVTSEGLFSAPGDATRSQAGSDELTAIPSPYRPASDASGVVINGLRAPTSDVRVMTVAGDVVYAAEVRGGSFRWDGRDRSGLPVPSGVYLVAVAGSDGSTTYGKVALIR